MATRRSTFAPAARRSRKVPEFHAHGCVSCGRRYQDSCKNGTMNADCTTCRTGHPAPLWDRDWAPVACCKKPKGCRLVTDVATLTKYLLGGTGPWFICYTCARTHPFDPMEDS
jgi:hypothetical protein